jgi:hypothetical protein
MKKRKEQATRHLRIYPSSHARLRVMAARRGVSIAAMVDILTKQKS